jgi:hypothetical protein
MFLRKFLTICLAVFIGFAQMGVALHVHYCAGEVVSVKTVMGFSELAAQMEDNCCGEDATNFKKMACCKDKKLKFKDTSEKLLVKDITPELLAFGGDNAFFSPVLSPIKTVCKKPILAYYCDAHGPPLYQRYSQLIFYA